MDPDWRCISNEKLGDIPASHVSLPEGIYTGRPLDPFSAQKKVIRFDGFGWQRGYPKGQGNPFHKGVPGIQATNSPLVDTWCVTPRKFNIAPEKLPSQ